ncbi:MAG: hypothetical protein AAGA96_14335 [Verrucomicrobiota bacterium]
MNPETTVSIHPYFRPHEGKFDEFVASLQAFVDQTSSEEEVLFYDFTICDGVVFCREAYQGAAGALAHLENVGTMLEQALGISELLRLEVHGTAAELDKMREPLKDLPVEWFVLQTGLKK